ncbi:hypothetical protein ACFYRL_28760 [Streptomyces goshikiensis]|uniref:hypothetical protein n=1 Tax=Streptomyces goshikiensis TaxID=1942 RepID=UPI003682EE6E
MTFIAPYCGVTLATGTTPMSAYERQLWEALNEHWQRRNNRRGLPNWASTALGRTGEVAGKAVRRVTAQRYCQTRFLCDKYGLPLPAALAADGDDDPQPDAT